MSATPWPPCVVSYFDMVGTTKLAPSGEGSARMRALHAHAAPLIASALPKHAHGYVWNDSILLLSHETKPAANRSALLAELSNFKALLEEAAGVKTYAIVVMGCAFPARFASSPNAVSSRVTVLQTSSWAMANCFRIEDDLRKHRADWYIDSRVCKGVQLPKPFAVEEVILLPKQSRRNVFMYKGSLH